MISEKKERFVGSSCSSYSVKERKYPGHDYWSFYVNATYVWHAGRIAQNPAYLRV